VRWPVKGHGTADLSMICSFSGGTCLRLNVH